MDVFYQRYTGEAAGISEKEFIHFSKDSSEVFKLRDLYSKNAKITLSSKFIYKKIKPFNSQIIKILKPFNSVPKRVINRNNFGPFLV